MKHFIVDENNVRLDIFLSRVLHCSRQFSQTLIKSGSVIPRDLSASSRLVLGFKLTVLDCSSIKKVFKNDFLLSILYEDNDVLVINKPCNLLVHSYNDSGEFTLVDLLKNYQCSLSDGFLPERPGLVHRLDKATEGLMVIAKTNVAQDHLKTQFASRTIQKGYYAFVYGKINTDYLCIEKPLQRHGHLWRVFNQGKHAKTEVFVIKRWSTKTLLYLKPLTGRTHQLRVHLFSVGFPIIGDPFYGKVKGSGQLLQSSYLSFVHPSTNIRYSFSIPLSTRLSQKC